MLTKIKFKKMHGLGNDFVVINAINQAAIFDIKKINILQLSDRHLGIGFDQMLIIKKSSHPKQADFFCQILNANGSEAEQCGNGMRCVARFIHEEKLNSHHAFKIETKSGVVDALIQNSNYDTIQIKMGLPIFDTKKTPFDATLVSMGNPHAILKVAAIKDAPVLTLGASIATHEIFPEGTNVGFMEIVNPQHILLRTFERGVGETFACGSNACAAAVAGIKYHKLARKVKVELALGNLWIEWPDDKSPVMMTGPATNVFDGFISSA